MFGFSFYAAHYVGAWVFIGGFVAHVALKLPHMRRALRSRSLRAELRTPSPPTRPEEPDPARPGRPRPGAADDEPPRALALVGGGSLLVAALTAGQTVGGPLRGLALLLPRGRTTATADGGPNDFPVNKTFVASGIEPGVLDAWVLELTGGAAAVRLDYAGLAALPRHTATLPIACVEGWSTVQDWTGVRLRDLAALAGVPAPASAVVRSLEQGPFAQATLTSGQVRHPDALLALAVNGAAARAGPRLPGAGDRPGAARGAQHEVGPLDRVPERLMRRLYGAGPAGHLAALLLAFAVAGYAASIVAGDPLWPWMAVWFVAVVRRARRAAVPARRCRRRRAAVRPAVVSSPARAPDDRQLRPGARAGGRADVPDVLPGIVRQGEPVVRGQTGLDQGPFLGRWLLLVAAMAAVSALVYGVRRLTRPSAAGG